MNVLKLTFIIILISCIVSCKQESNKKVDIANNEEQSILIDSLTVLKTDLVLNPIEGKWYYKGNPFNGYSVKYYANGALAEKLGFIKGKREGVGRRWSKTGVLREEFYYKYNRLDGTYKMWWDNGVLEAEINYVNGLKQGEEKEWYPNGKLAKLRQLVDDKEHGLQKAWLQNGKLYVNYEAKNGRIFGMKRANSCYKLEDEVVIKNKNTK
ncbi:toxin-antitoxin system YwqK family antitoxin [Seonamhaeicola sp.]|uniref:toxin-antitoxin system YwqK family antitoxin n=1 Tax=Seonamhaeicola sp. TaxID=1912245 RepID=UPI0035687667